MKIDPILAVKDVEETSKWYQSIFDCKSKHGGNTFEVLINPDGDIFLCLHKWGAHEHPTFTDPSLTPGNGLILYFRLTNMEQIYNRLNKINFPIEREIQLNPNSGRKEFSIIDPNGYYLTISEYHEYEG